MKSAVKLMNAALVLAGGMLLAEAPIMAQYDPAPAYAPQDQLSNLVSRVALYPDPLLAQIFAAAPVPDQIAQAAQWASQYRNLSGDQLANAAAQANLPFDAAVQALIPFPNVLDMMAADPNWTRALGDAVMTNQAAVMDAVQQLRRTAQEYGYLQSNQQMNVVDNGGEVEIAPVDPGYIYVPVYDPYVVFAQPRPGFFVGGAIRFGSGFYVGGFTRWGWGSGGFNWRNHNVVVNHRVWAPPVHVYENTQQFNNNGYARTTPAPEYNNRYNGSRYQTPAPAVRSQGFTGNRTPTVTPQAPAVHDRSVERRSPNFGGQNFGGQAFGGNRQPSPAPAPAARSFERAAPQQHSFTPQPRNEGGHSERGRR